MRRLLLLIFLLAFGFCHATVLKVGDRIRIQCDENPTLCITRVLDFQGVVQLPNGASVLLFGLEPEAAAQLIARAAHQNLGQIVVTLDADSSRPVSIEGAVRFAGFVALTPSMRLSDIVRLGDPTVAADLDAIEIETAAGDLMTIAFDPNPLYPAQNPYLHAGDRVIFPLATQAAQVMVLGGVAKPGAVPYVRGMTVRAAIDACGGVTNHGNERDVRVLKLGVERARFDLAQSPNLELKRGDTVVVAMSSVRYYVTVVGEVKRGGLIPWKQGMTLSEAINLAGGPTDKGDIEALRVQRILGEDRFRRRMAMSTDQAFVLNQNDVIQVPLKGTSPKAVPPSREPRRVVPPR